MRVKDILPSASPEEVGVPSSAVIRFLDEVEQAEPCMHSLILVRQGKIFTEGYWRPFHRDKEHRLYSCTKSFVSIAVGFLIDEGKLSLEDRIVSFFPDKLPSEGVHPYIAETTIRHMLMMATPHDVTTYSRMQMDDWVATFFLCRPSHLPGTVFTYDTSSSHVLGALVERLSGQSFMEYLRIRLLDPLGFSPVTRCLTDPVGIAWGGSGIICRPVDFAKVALTCMQHGRFRTKQLIPEWYIREAVSRQIDCYLSGRKGYGYQFWCLPHNGFAFLGMGSQVAVCLPDQDFLLVTTGDSLWQPGYQTLFDALWKHLFPCLCNETLPPDANNQSVLADRLSSLSIRTVSGRYGSPLTRKINGRQYRMYADNQLGMEELSFTFHDQGGSMNFRKSTGQYRLDFGYGVNVMQAFPGYAYEAVVSGGWSDDGTLDICCYVIDEHLATLRMVIAFRGDTVTVRMQKASEIFDEYSGFASGSLV
jgi:CubicO group peptidase (beta-lactamase class C family)